MQKFKMILSKIQWNKKSGLREWSMEHPIRSIVLCGFYTYGVRCFAKNMSKRIENYVQNSLNEPIVEGDI